jgi:cytidylate kinase
VNEPASGSPLTAGRGSVIVLTGPPGAGKSAVARLLAGSRAYGVHLHSDDFWRYIKRGQIAPYLPQARQQNQTVIDALARAASAYAAGGYQVICDGIVGPWFIGAFRARPPLPIELRAGTPSLSFVMRTEGGFDGRDRE